MNEKNKKIIVPRLNVKETVFQAKKTEGNLECNKDLSAPLLSCLFFSIFRSVIRERNILMGNLSDLSRKH